MSDTRPLDDICILNNNNVFRNNESIIYVIKIKKEKKSSKKSKTIYNDYIPRKYPKINNNLKYKTTKKY